MLPLGLPVWDSFNRQIRTYFVLSLLFMRRIAAVKNFCCEMNLDCLEELRFKFALSAFPWYPF